MIKPIPLLSTIIIFLCSLIIIISPLRPDITSITPELKTTPTPFQYLIDYHDSINRFDIKIPRSYQKLGDSSDFPNLISWQAPDQGTFQIQIYPSQKITLSQYLKNYDLNSKTSYEGKPSTKILNTQNITLSGNPAVERKETWLAAGFDALATYTEIDDKIVVFYAYPYESASVDIAIRDYHQILSTFKFNQ